MTELGRLTSAYCFQARVTNDMKAITGDSGQATKDRSSQGRKAGNPQSLLTRVLWDLRNSGTHNPDTRDSKTKVPLPPCHPHLSISVAAVGVNPKVTELEGTSQRAMACFLHELPELGHGPGWADQLPRCSLSSLGPPSWYQGPKPAGHSLRQTQERV